MPLSSTTPATCRFVLTGGPGAGKTVISHHLAEKYPHRWISVPEAATQVYDSLQTRWDKLDTAGRRDVQQKIYQLQIQQERQIASAHPGKSLLLDRGTIDGAAYWPGGPEEYWREVASTPAKEYQRYDTVIWMQSGAALGFYDGETSNPRRHESPAVAIASGDRVANLWQHHPHFHRVPAFPTLAQKIAEVEKILLTAESNSPQINADERR
jgi:predicted ATPase